MTNRIQEIQSELREREIDAWLFCDHHHRDPIAYRILGLPVTLMVTRRWFYLIPAQGEPIKLVHRIEPFYLDTLPGDKHTYASWQELVDGLRQACRDVQQIAMQFSPDSMIFSVSLIDAGTVDLIRGLGKNVVSSANLVSKFDATWTEEQIQSHFAARDSMDSIMAAVFPQIRQRLQKGGATEFDIQRWLLEAFRRESLVTDSAPVVAVNQNSSNAHYAPSADYAAPIRDGDFILLDIWAKKNSPGAVYYDISWVGFAGGELPSRVGEIFEIVKRSRDAGIRRVKDSVESGHRLQGWEVDKAARDVLDAAGYGAYLHNRVGHSIGTEVHGNGANMDNFESRDEREVLPNTCFSIEPGIYLPEFGLRSEINMLVQDGSAEVTGRIQDKVVLI